MDLLLVIVVVALVVAFLAAPLRRGTQVTEDAAESARRADLEARRDAKYREIRDAEMDYRMGKLSESDWRALDRELRAQAIAILRQLDDLGDGRR